MAKLLVAMELRTFGQRLAWLREIAEVGSRELGRLAGFSESYASVVEGSRGGPSTKTLASVAAVFAVDWAWLGSGEGALPDEDEVRAAVVAARKRLEAPTGTEA